MNTPVFTTTPDGEEIVILSRADYEALVRDEKDLATAMEVIDALKAGKEEALTFEDVQALAAAPTPLAFWRKKRGVTQAELATHAGVPQSYISDIENGHKQGNPQLLRQIADYLQVSLDDLIP